MMIKNIHRITADKLALLALFLTIFVDASGMALVYPVLTPLFVHNQTHLFSPDVSEQIRHLTYGFVLAIYPIMMFIGSPFLGALSDRHGRRPILITCIAGNLIGLLMMGFGVTMNSVAIIILARMISGMTAASLPVAQAAIIDLSTEKTKVKNLSLITAANSIGFTVGPMITGVLSHPLFAYTPSLASPFYFAVLLPAITLFLLIFHFKETYPGNKDLQLNIMLAFHSIYHAFKHPKTKTPLYILAGFLVGYYIFFNYLSMFALLAFGYKQFMESMLLSYFAIICAISFLFIIPYLTHRFTLNQCLLISIAPQCLSILSLVLLTRVETLWLISTVMAIFVPCTYVVLLGILSNNTEKEFQGRVMGVSSSVNSLAWGVAPLLTAALQSHSILLPLVISASVLLMILFLSISYVRGFITMRAANA